MLVRCRTIDCVQTLTDFVIRLICCRWDRDLSLLPRQSDQERNMLLLHNLIVSIPSFLLLISCFLFIRALLTLSLSSLTRPLN